MLFLRPIFLRQALLCGSALVSGWMFQSRAITPLNLRDEALVRKRTELQDNLQSTHEKLLAIKEFDGKIGEARGVLNRLAGDQGETSMIVAFPKEMVEHFTRFGFSSASVRLVKASQERDLPGYQRLYWSIGIRIPSTERHVEGLLLATAELQQNDRYVKVVDFTLQPDVKDSSLRTASVDLVVLSKK